MNELEKNKSEGWWKKSYLRSLNLNKKIVNWIIKNVIFYKKKYEKYKTNILLWGI